VQLKIDQRTIGGVLVLDCTGRIVFGEESVAVRDTVKQLMTTTNRMVLNLAGVSYIDSGGLGTLVGLFITARNAGGSIKLAGLTERVTDVLQVTKLLTVFDTYPNVDAAVKSFA
jgi:anti-sigma B factor antagonist